MAFPKPIFLFLRFYLICNSPSYFFMLWLLHALLFKGLEYITEIQIQGEVPYFHCELCDAKFDNNLKLPHIVGTKHRYQFIVSAFHTCKFFLTRLVSSRISDDPIILCVKSWWVNKLTHEILLKAHCRSQVIGSTTEV